MFSAEVTDQILVSLNSSECLNTLRSFNMFNSANFDKERSHVNLLNIICESFTLKYLNISEQLSTENQIYILLLYLEEEEDEGTLGVISQVNDEILCQQKHRRTLSNPITIIDFENKARRTTFMPMP